MLALAEDSLALITLASLFVALLSVIIFEVPRYLFATLAMAACSVTSTGVPDRTIKVSVIISSFNGANFLAQNVRTLQRQIPISLISH